MRPGILSDAGDLMTPKVAVEVDAEAAELEEPKWMGLPAALAGVPTKLIVVVGLALGAAKASTGSWTANLL